MTSTIVDTAVEVVAGVFFRQVSEGPEILVFQRLASDLGGGQWEFPGGKVEAGENHEQALMRELLEELGVVVEVGESVGESIFAYPNKKIHLWAYFCQTDNWQFTLTDHQDFKWVSETAIGSIALSEADRPLVSVIFEKLRK